MPFYNQQEVGKPLKIKDEGITIVPNASEIDFKGAGVTGTNTGDAVVETIPGGSEYTLPTAAAATLGGVKVGSRLSIDGSGVLSADVQTTDLTGQLHLDQTTPQTIINGQPIQNTLTASEIVATDSNKKLSSLAVATYPSLTELSYVKGVDASIQPQIEALEQASFYAGTMTVNAGTLDTGTVADLQAVGGTDVNISEATGADPLTVTFDFTGVTKLSAFAFYGYYAGGSGHEIDVEIYNVGTTNWDKIGAIGTETMKRWYDFAIFNTSAYINTGAVSVRLRHIQTGINTHDLILDYLELNYGSTGGSSSISAASVSFTPSGSIAATNVGAALMELDTEKANTELSNLGTTAINTSLVSDTDNTDDLGTTLKKWANLFVTTIGATATRITKGWFTDIESTNIPTVGGTALLTSITDPQFTTIELGHASDTTLSRSAAGVLAVEGVVIPSISSTNTLTNKRHTRRVYSTTSLATLTPEIDTYDLFHLTAQGGALTIANHSTSTPTDGEQIKIRILDNGTARAISFGTNYVAKAGVALPTTTVLSKNLVLGFEWNANLSKWNLLASGQEA